MTKKPRRHFQRAACKPIDGWVPKRNDFVQPDAEMEERLADYIAAECARFRAIQPMRNEVEARKSFSTPMYSGQWRNGQMIHLIGE